MNDNRNLLTHIKTDPNAKYHLLIGAVVGIIACLDPHVLAPFFAALMVGIIIEVWQRGHGGKNTMRESIMDALTTSIPGAVLSLIKFIGGLV
ncbi:hypothetical protein D6779_07040 [Candidatus Parcubacteria bacterium]|nr:MAG: hypothetical protein D6779_07040 [Candidatus Parcubacteria bacterium]